MRGFSGNDPIRDLQPPVQKVILRLAIDRGYGRVLQPDRRLRFPLADIIDRPVAGHLSQPERNVRVAFEFVEAFVQLQEYVLRHFLGRSPVTQEMVGDAEHH